MYGQLPFALSMVIAEIPYSLICALGFYVCIYFPPGLNLTAPHAGYQFFMVLICEQFSVTLAQMIAALTPNTYMASLLNPPIIVIFALFCGVTVPKPNIPWFWREFLYQLDPFTRLIGGMVVTELHGEKVTCASSEYNTFKIPDGQTCESYAGRYMSAATGYIQDLNATGSCDYCSYKGNTARLVVYCFQEGLTFSSW